MFVILVFLKSIILIVYVLYLFIQTYKFYHFVFVLISCFLMVLTSLSKLFLIFEDLYFCTIFTFHVTCTVYCLIFFISIKLSLYLGFIETYIGSVFFCMLCTFYQLPLSFTLFYRLYSDKIQGLYVSYLLRFRR